MTAISYATAVDSRRLPFKDRRTSLKVAGVLLLIMGALCGCFGALTPVAMYVGPMLEAQAPAPPGGQKPYVPAADYATMALAGATYLVLAAVLIWMGVGSVRLRRWARPVVLVVCGTWLLTGVMSCVHWALFGAGMREMMTAGMPPGTPPPPNAVIYTVTAVMGTVMFLVLVALPALFLWLYLRRGVRETVEYFDPRFVWTDRCPTAVLLVAGWLALAGLGSAVYSVYAVLPLYGWFVTGAPAVAALLALAAVFLWLAYAVYRLRPFAWWGTSALWTLWAGSMIWTFTSRGYHEFYRAAGYSPQDVDMMMRFNGQFEDSMVWMMALWSIGLVAYLLYVRKFFVAGPPPEPGATAGEGPTVDAGPASAAAPAPGA